MRVDRVEIRKGPERTYLVASVSREGDTILDAGLTGAKAREEGGRLASGFKVPLIDCTVESLERWPGGAGKLRMARA
jgi:hypothetical protein